MKPTFLAVAGTLIATAVSAQTVHTQQILSKVYTIDKKYRSMEGPSSMQRINIGNPEKPELIWIVGVKTEMVGEDGTTPQLPELMCHVNVDLDPAKHQALFDFKRTTAARLMTLSQGMLEAKLPKGFGFPISSNEPLLLFTQVLNHNIDHPKNLLVRHRVTFDYVVDKETTEPMKPLFNIGASGMVQLENNPLALTTSMMPSAGGAMTHDEHEGAAASCLIGARAPQAAATSSDYTDPSGRKMTGHWTVPPGRQVNASDITWFMNLPYDTRVHYAAFHLHPFAESLSVRDTTTAATILKANARNPETGIGLTHVDTFASVEGLPLYRDHKYDLMSVYNNTSKASSDSMASVFLGLADPEFARSEAADFSKRATALLDADTIVVHTTAGDLKAHLMRDLAPSTSMQVARLVYAGVFNGATATDNRSDIKVTAPLSPKAIRLLQPVTDRQLPFDKGTVAYCPPNRENNELSLRFVSDNTAAQDARCLPFARLTEGTQLIEAITKAPVGVSAFVSSVSVSR